MFNIGVVSLLLSILSLCASITFYVKIIAAITRAEVLVNDLNIQVKDLTPQVKRMDESHRKHMRELETIATLVHMIQLELNETVDKN